MTKEDRALEIIEEKLSVKNESVLEPKDFFKDRKGLYIGYEFENRILEKTSPVKSGTELNVASYKLIKYATDEQIENSLPAKHIFTEDEVCLVISELISKQSNGEEGVLQNNGYANLFYTPAFVVSVRWSSGGRHWRVHAWRRDDSGWSDGFRVFSPVN